MIFEVKIYKVDDSLCLCLEDYLKNTELSDIVDLEPGIYKESSSYLIQCKNLEEMMDAVEELENLKISDLIEWRILEEKQDIRDDVLDYNSIKHSIDIKKLVEQEQEGLNWFIKKFWGLAEIAVDREMIL